MFNPNDGESPGPSEKGHTTSQMDNNERTNEVSPEAKPLTGSRSCDLESENDAYPRGQWSSQIEYLLTVIGYSVGISNVLRFPYICSRNGGGAFLIPYLVCLVLIGLPLFFLEVAIGQFSGKGALHTWSLCPLMKGIGIGMLVIAMGDPTFYTIICAWSMYYAISSFRAVLPWTSCDNTWNTDNCVTSVNMLNQDVNRTVGFNDTGHSQLVSLKRNISYTHNGWDNHNLSHTAAEEFWQYKALGITDRLGDLGSVRWELTLCLLGSWTIIFLCVSKGIKSVGKAVYITATIPYIVLLVLLVRGLTLPGGTTGALFFITPDFSKLLNVQVWLEACLQVINSLGPVQGGLITMASYNKFHTNCLRNAVLCTLVSEGTSLFAGLVVFSILGFMAHEADVPITDVVSSGPGLGFVTYPEVLAQFALPQLWTILFFIMLIFLALDTLFGMVETGLSAIFDGFPFLLRWRVPITATYCACSFLLGIILTTEGGMYIFQLFDWYAYTLFFIAGGCFECIVVGWLYGVKRFSSDIEMMIGRQAPVFFKVAWCYVTPLLLLITFFCTLTQYTPPTYGKYMYPKYASVIGLCCASLPMMPIIIMMILALYKGHGSLLQRLTESVVPDGSWGPSEHSYRQRYLEQNNTRVTLKEACLHSLSVKT